MRSNYFEQPIVIKIHLIILMFCLILFGTQCVDQRSSPPKGVKTPIDSTKFQQLNGQVVDIKHMPKGVISEMATDQYPSITYHFHDAQGKEVKTIREDQFLSRNPVFKLPFPKNTDVASSGRYYKSLSDFDDKTGRELPRVNIASKVRAFNTLKKHGLYVKSPETATEIVGGPSKSGHVITPPSSIFLVHCETASIFYKFSRDSVDEKDEVTSNSLLDCTYITVYNHLGKAVQDFLVPDKLIDAGWVSDDGRYLFCGYSVGHIWDEGTNTIPTGFLIIDLQTKQITPIEIPIFRGYAGDVSGFFSDGFFQMQSERRKFLYVNPYTRDFYTYIYKREEIKGKKSLLYKSFMPFEGLKVDISQYQRQSY